MDLAIMIEGQDGLNWERWKWLAAAAEGLGFAGLYRSDHFTNSRPPEKDSLELWISLAYLATQTKRIQFGPLVTPFSFRHPALTARMAAAVDDLSGGRLHLGLGAGWQEREHDMFGLPLLNLPERMRRFKEGMDVVTTLLKSDAPVNYNGKYFQLQDAILLPRPQRPGGPPILVGGNGQKRTLQIAAKYGAEWNAISLTPQDFRQHCERLDEFLLIEGRQPADVRRSLMTGVFIGPERVARITKAAGKSAAEVRASGRLVGQAGEIVAQLGALAEAGCQRVMLQWLDQDDMLGLEEIASQVLPQIK
ncbi:MAG: TIGR03560 family F420-dependent LLM class oxidoreductase [Anaerolineales bacterium]